MSRIDVFVPCYNYGRFLRASVRSILNQQGVDVRVLILDDASADDSPEVGRELAAEDSRVEYRRHETNRGHIATYNEGIDWASGDYVLLLSADDMLVQGALARAARVMNERPEVGLAYGFSFETDRPETAQAPIKDDYQVRIVPGPAFFEESCRIGWNLISPPTAVVRTSIQKRVGAYRKELPHTGDMEMWMRISLFASLACIDTYQAYYRQHGQNMHHGYKRIRDVQQSRAALDALFSEYPERIIDRERIHQLAYGNLAQRAFWYAREAFDRGAAAECEELLSLARDLDPTIRRWGPWQRLRLKRLLGQRGWRVLRPLVRWFRHSSKTGTNL